MIRRPEPTRLLVANLDKDKAGDRRYVRRLRKSVRRSPSKHGALALVEYGHGTRSTRLIGVRTWLRHRRPVEIGDVGVHNGVARAWIRIDGVWVMLLCAHGLHRKSTSPKAQATYYDLLAEHTNQLSFDGTPWAVLGDFNDNPERVARTLGGVGHGERGDVMGAITSGLTVHRAGSTDIGRRRGWTGHIEFYIDVTPSKEKS